LAAMFAATSAVADDEGDYGQPLTTSEVVNHFAAHGYLTLE
jgi:hypothetical protein